MTGLPLNDTLTFMEITTDSMTGAVTRSPAVTGVKVHRQENDEAFEYNGSLVSRSWFVIFDYVDGISEEQTVQDQDGNQYYIGGLTRNNWQGYDIYEMTIIASNK